MNIERAYLESNLSEIYYEITGSGSAIIFAHGLGGNHLSWWQQIPYFSEHYTCITFAHRGFLPSKNQTETIDPKLFTQDLTNLINHLKLSSVILVAQSMGGWTCFDYALKEQDKVKALVLAASVGSVTHPSIESFLQNTKTESEKIRSKGINPAAGQRMLNEQSHLYFLYEEINLLNQDINKDELRKKLHDIRKTDPEQLHSLTMPILCISGEEDVVMPPSAVELFSSFLPDSRFIKVPQAGHSVYFEQANTFNKLVNQFILELK